MRIDQLSRIAIRRDVDVQDYRAQCLAVVVVLGLFLLSGCGGAGSGGGSNTPDFSLSIPASVSLVQASSTTITAGVTGLNGFGSQINVTISGLPSGVSASPSQFSLSPGDQQQVVITALIQTAAGTTNLQVSGTSGSLQHSVQIALTVSVSTSAPPVPTRTHYDRTDDLWDVSFLNFFPQDLIIYDPGTKRFFVSDTSLNRVEVFDATTELQIGQITVPGAFVGDETPDHKSIFMGTQIGDVYEIDPVAMAVTARFPAVQIGPSGFPTYEVRALANGTLALLSGQGGIPAVDGWSAVGIWNPATNALNIAGSAGVQSGCALQTAIVELAVTADRTKILLGSGVSEGSLCLYDPATGSQTVADTNPNGIGVGQILVPPDGKEILVASGSAISVYELPDLQQTDQIELGNGMGFYNYALSFDGSTVFAIAGDGAASLAYDWETHQQLGWVTNFVIYDSPGNPTPMAVDETGLIASAIGHGVAFLDGAALQAQAPEYTFGFGYSNVVQPTFGPLQGGSQTVITGVQITNVEDVVFGKEPATIVSTGSQGIAVTTPENSPGPTDVSMTATDGSFLLLPQSYSYGPSIVETIPNASSADGGGTGTIYGYGFGDANLNGQAPSLTVSLNGQPVEITQYLPEPFYQADTSYPFPLEAVQFTMPAGKSGASGDVTVSNSAGSATASNAIQYTPAVQQYALAGASLAQGIYDSKRDVYYFTDQTQVRVFSRTQGAWLTSIPMPAGAQRLWGIALSPDGSKLAVSDAGASQIYLLDPDAPSAISTFPIPTTGFDIGDEPCGLAILNSGAIYYATFEINYTGGWAFHVLDTSTSTVTDLEFVQGNGGSDAYIRVQLSSDNTRVYFNVGGLVFLVDTATNTAFSNPTLVADDYELTLSSNQTWMASNEYLMDTNLNPESYVTYIDRDTWNQTAVYGEKISADGNLLFSPLLNAIDVIDGREGLLRTRVALPVTLSPIYDALVDDGTDNVLLAITGQTGNGIAVIDLSTLPEPAPSVKAALSRSGLLPKAEWTTQKAATRKPVIASRTPAIQGSAQKTARPRHILISPAIHSLTH